MKNLGIYSFTSAFICFLLSSASVYGQPAGYECNTYISGSGGIQNCNGGYPCDGNISHCHIVDVASECTYEAIDQDQSKVVCIETPQTGSFPRIQCCDINQPDEEDDGNDDNTGSGNVRCDATCEISGVLDENCVNCMCSGGVFSGHVWTEIGCITPTQKGVVAAVLRIFIGVISAIVVIRFIQAGMLFNSDDPDKISEAKSIATSAIIALIFGAMIPIILNFIGVDILGLGQILGIG